MQWQLTNNIAKYMEIWEGYFKLCIPFLKKGKQITKINPFGSNFRRILNDILQRYAQPPFAQNQ